MNTPYLKEVCLCLLSFAGILLGLAEPHSQHYPVSAVWAWLLPSHSLLCSFVNLWCILRIEYVKHRYWTINVGTCLTDRTAYQPLSTISVGVGPNWQQPCMSPGFLETTTILGGDRQIFVIMYTVLLKAEWGSDVRSHHSFIFEQAFWRVVCGGSTLRSILYFSLSFLSTFPTPQRTI